MNENPSLIKKVHLDYLKAGANIITTASYQANFIGFEKQGYTKEDAIRLMQFSVELAIDARITFLTNSVQIPQHIPFIAASCLFFCRLAPWKN